MTRRRLRSLSTPIIAGTITVPLAVAMLVAWTIAFVQSGAFDATWLMVLGIISLSVIVLALALLSVFLAREILEGLRQVSFIDSVTHELKSPLASIKLNLETLARDLSDQQREALRQMMLSDVDRLTAFIDDVLVAHRVTHAGAIEHEVVRVPLLGLAERSVERAMRRHDLTDGVHLEIPDDLVVRSGATSVETVLNNLVDNAVKYSDCPVEVVVRAEVAADGDVELTVTDRGIGIPAEAVKHVFQRFFRAPGEAVRARRGTGLGLFVVQALVRALGGRVRVDSAGAGTGTTVRVRLPADMVETGETTEVSSE